MRMLDEKGDRKIERAILFLTKDEALELRDALQAVIDQPRGNHAHVPDQEYKREITVCVYDPTAIGDEWDARSQELLREDR